VAELALVSWAPARRFQPSLKFVACRCVRRPLHVRRVVICSAIRGGLHGLATAINVKPFCPRGHENLPLHESCSMNCSRALLIGLGVSMTAHTALAAEPDSSARNVEISLDQARRRAELRAPEAQIASNQIREAQATRVGAGVFLPTNPRISIDGRRGLDKASKDNWGYAVGVDALFEVGGAPGARVREADARTRAARTNFDLVRLESRLGATEAYVSTALARYRAEHAREALSIADRLLGTARERLAAGAGNEVELSSADAEAAQAQAELHAAQGEERLSQMELRRLADLPLSGPLQLTSKIDTPSEAPSSAALLARAHSRQQPDIADVDARLALLTASDQRLGREAFPKVGAFGLVDSSPASPRYGVLGLSFELPFPQRNQGPRAVVAAQRHTELARRASLRRQIDLEIVHRRSVHEAARSELSVVTARAIPTAERRLALVEEGWRAGRFDVFRVTTAARDLVRLKALRLEVLHRIWAQRLTLERLTGVFDHDQQ
jgi:outer membrane protein, heavy metal efflux system